MRVILVLDNFIAHKSSATLERFSPYEREGRLERFFLPRYAPELNPMEKIWQQMRRRATHNHRFPTLEELEIAVDDFFTELEQNPEAIISLIGSRKEREMIYTA